MDKTSDFLKAAAGIVVFVWFARVALREESTFVMVVHFLILGVFFAYPAYWLYSRLALTMTGERYSVKFAYDYYDKRVILIDRYSTDRKEVIVNEDGSGYYDNIVGKAPLWDEAQKALDAFLKKNASEIQRRKDVEAERYRQLIESVQSNEAEQKPLALHKPRDARKTG